MSRLYARLWAWWFTWVCPPWTEEYAAQAPSGAVVGSRDRTLRGKARRKARRAERRHGCDGGCR